MAVKLRFSETNKPFGDFICTSNGHLVYVHIHVLIVLLSGDILLSGIAKHLLILVHGFNQPLIEHLFILDLPVHNVDIIDIQTNLQVHILYLRLQQLISGVDNVHLGLEPL